MGTEQINNEFPSLNLKEGDWIFSDYFKSANKIIKISNGVTHFAFPEENKVTSGRLEHLENRTNIKSYRYATSEEIIFRLESELAKLKQNHK